MVTISAKELKDFVFNVFVKRGANSSEAEDVSSHLVTSNLMGHDSHGVVRMRSYIERIKKREIVSGAPIHIENETPSSAMVNGNWGFGQTIAKYAMNLAIDKAIKNVISCITIRQCNHIGRLGAYSSIASAKGMIGMVMANLHGRGHWVVPFGGIEPKLSTNPISISFPSGKEIDFTLDMSTSVVSEGKINVKFNTDDILPVGWAVDIDGNPCVSANEFYAKPHGAILPLGGVVGYKGFGLSLAVDVLSGALSGAFCTGSDATRHGNSCFIVVIRIDAFSSVSEFEHKVSALIDHVKSSKRVSDADDIYMPGEPEYKNYQRYVQTGIQLDDKTWNELSLEANELGISLPSISK